MSEKTIDLKIECPSCKGTGLYSGMGEGKGVAVICNNCKGTGKFNYKYTYKPFTGRKERKDVKRVYLSGLGYRIGLGKINFSNGIGEIDMDKEGVSYDEFINGKMPEHIKKLGCPMNADQGACHAKKGFVNTCNELGLSLGGLITNCKNQPNRLECWKRFKKGD
jgi:hypothetical protein